MEKDEYIGIIVILGIIAIAAFGGNKYRNSNNGTLVDSSPIQQQTLQEKIVQAQVQVNDLKKQIQAQTDAKNRSIYFGKVKIQYINHSENTKNEYVVLHEDDYSTTTIPVTGWSLRIVSSGDVYTISKASQLFFSGVVNDENPIILYPGDTVYVNTGLSPTGSNFKVNKCTGYLSQFQSFIPYLYTNCPLPRNEDTTSISRLPQNEECLKYLYSYQACKTQIETLPASFTYECKKFIIDKLNYPACVNTHKYDSDFYLKQWYVYLRQNKTIWDTIHSDITLYDSDGKVVDILKYNLSF